MKYKNEFRNPLTKPFKWTSVSASTIFNLNIKTKNARDPGSDPQNLDRGLRGTFLQITTLFKILAYFQDKLQNMPLNLY